MWEAALKTARNGAFATAVAWQKAVHPPLLHATQQTTTAAAAPRFTNLAVPSLHFPLLESHLLLREALLMPMAAAPPLFRDLHRAAFGSPSSSSSSSSLESRVAPSFSSQQQQPSTAGTPTSPLRQPGDSRTPTVEEQPERQPFHGDHPDSGGPGDDEDEDVDDDEEEDGGDAEQDNGDIDID